MDRNLDPKLVTAEVIAARWLWGHEYSKQNGGQVDFWEKLSEPKKRLCQEFVDEIVTNQDRRYIRARREVQP